MRRLVVFIVALSVPLTLLWSDTATAATHPTYALGHAKKCRVDYVKRTEKHRVKDKSVRYVACVYVAPRTAASSSTTSVSGLPTASGNTGVTTTTVVTTVGSTGNPSKTYVYKTSLDPSFVQSPTNPLSVTYTFTADATQTEGQQTIDLAQAGQLPAGILELYSNGTLKCSINVGAATTGGTCGVTYSAYGVQSVTTDYLPSGVTPVTESDPEDIERFATSIAVNAPFLGSTVNINNYAYQVVSIPVSLSGLTTSLGTTGAVSLTNTDATNESCQSLSYNAQLGSATATCTAEVEDDPNVPTNWTPLVSFSGDNNYAASTTTGSQTAIPAAPAPTIDDVTVELQCAESGGFCSEYNSSPETTSADANVYAGPEYEDVSPQVGTVTFTSADHLLICTASVYSAANLASNNARCTGDGGPFEGPLSVQYSGGTIETGDTVETVYSSASTSGGSN